MFTKKKKSWSGKLPVLKAGDWEFFLLTQEGVKIPLFQTFLERHRFNRDLNAKFVFRRMQ